MNQQQSKNIEPDSNAPDNNSLDNNSSEKATFLQIVFSILAAAIGVQSDKNRLRDFNQSSPWPFIIGGIIFTILFVLSIIGVVMLALP
ncbi:MAG: DUF2970 domain-containing protein [Pseudomonadales bacterium]|nr:DUF2970 domain-containing protein [Pseudomonadales bacterium]